jgi:hypothetical protein
MKQNVTSVGIVICIGLAVICVGFGFWEWGQGHQEFFGGEQIVAVANAPAPATRHLITSAPAPQTAKGVGWGDYGSFLQGTTASLWSLAGFLLILVAFLAQKQQLGLQQKQFGQQSFENHFFQLLTLHRNIVDDLRLDDCSAKGSSVFKVLHGRLQSRYNGSVDGPIERDTEALAVTCYEKMYDEHPQVLGHYFRTLYHIIKFVHESCPTEKKRYTGIVRAQLSTFEHVLLHYNGLCEYGEVKFKPHIQEYELLENMGPGFLVNPKHPTSYSKKAFGDDAALFVFRNVSSSPAQ